MCLTVKIPKSVDNSIFPSAADQFMKQYYSIDHIECLRKINEAYI